jgi:hypothetical protein
MKVSRNERTWRLDEERKTQRQCDHPGCSQEGEYRAPRARDRLTEYYWFCLDHVRAYNARWDYYAGMSEAEIERETRDATTWQRPTWPMGNTTGHRRFSFSFDDPLGMFTDEKEGEEAARARAQDTPETAAMRVLELDNPLTLVRLKARYKELVKRHHPDANGGDKAAEEKFKQISLAYTTLLNSLTL